MIVNNSCNNLILSNMNFWKNSDCINTNVKTIQCDESNDTSHEFKKRLTIKNNRFNRLHYNNEKDELIKKNYRTDRWIYQINIIRFSTWKKMIFRNKKSIILKVPKIDILKFVISKKCIEKNLKLEKTSFSKHDFGKRAFFENEICVQK